MPNAAEKDLAAFLAALPAYLRKEFEQGLSSLTQKEFDQWKAFGDANPEEYEARWREYLHLLNRVPIKLREYRKRKIRPIKDLDPYC